MDEEGFPSCHAGYQRTYPMSRPARCLNSPDYEEWASAILLKDDVLGVLWVNYMFLPGDRHGTHTQMHLLGVTMLDESGGIYIELQEPYPEKDPFITLKKVMMYIELFSAKDFNPSPHENKPATRTLYVNRPCVASRFSSLPVMIDIRPEDVNEQGARVAVVGAAKRMAIEFAQNELKWKMRTSFEEQAYYAIARIERGMAVFVRGIRRRFHNLRNYFNHRRHPYPAAASS